MDPQIVRVVVAGIFFWLWPVLMNRSGLNGNMSSLTFTGLVFTCIVPVVAYTEKMAIPDGVKWTFVLFAGLSGCIGILNFNGMTARATLAEFGSLYVIMLIVQVLCAALMQIVVAKQISMERVGGYIAAAITVFLLTKSNEHIIRFTR